MLLLSVWSTCGVFKGSACKIKTKWIQLAWGSGKLALKRCRKLESCCTIYKHRLTFLEVSPTHPTVIDQKDQIELKVMIEFQVANYHQMVY